LQGRVFPAININRTLGIVFELGGTLIAEGKNAVAILFYASYVPTHWSLSLLVGLIVNESWIAGDLLAVVRVVIVCHKLPLGHPAIHSLGACSSSQFSILNPQSLVVHAAQQTIALPLRTCRTVRTVANKSEVDFFQCRQVLSFCRFCGWMLDPDWRMIRVR
jgi:hypothetical protein